MKKFLIVDIFILRMKREFAQSLKGNCYFLVRIVCFYFENNKVLHQIDE